MYSLNADYYDKEFDSLIDLIDDVATSGMDPSYEITFNGQSTGEKAIDQMQF